jgi:hypothetical protein
MSVAETERANSRKNKNGGAKNPFFVEYPEARLTVVVWNVIIEDPD